MRNRLLHEAVFGLKANATQHQLYGWYQAEPELSWSCGTEAALIFPAITEGAGIGIELTCGSFEIPGKVQQVITPKANGRCISRPTPVSRGAYAWTAGRPPHEDRALVITLGLPNAGRPMDFTSSGDNRTLAIAAFRLRIFVLDDLPVATGRSTYACSPSDCQERVETLTGMSARELSMEFESLGDDCELGLVQRTFGAEPLSLLRFSAAALPYVLRGVDTDFSGIGDHLSTAMEGVEREWMVRDPDYDLRWHTFLLGDQATHESVIARETKKTSFLHQKLIRDIRSSEKIFVVKSRAKPAEVEQIMALHLALNRRSPSWLLWATDADDAHPVGFVEEIAPRLLRGRLPFADQDAPGWLALMTNAWLGRGDH